MLLLLLAGPGSHRVGRGRVADFTEHDIVVLQQLLGSAGIFYTTPHLLTELTNLLPTHTGAKLRILEELNIWHEHWEATRASLSDDQGKYNDIEMKLWLDIGAADWSIYRCCRATSATCITIDAKLCQWLDAFGLRPINFTHYRGLEH